MLKKTFEDIFNLGNILNFLDAIGLFCLALICFASILLSLFAALATKTGVPWWARLMLQAGGPQRDGVMVKI